jgi:hypothetical protein
VSSSPADRLDPIGLEELVATGAALQDRDERKYLVPLDRLDALAAALAPTHRALEIGGGRAFRYATTYFDTPGLTLLREHVQGRRRRFKVRRRTYLDSGQSQLEVKLKGRRGRTVKHALPGGAGWSLGATERGFVREVVADGYGRPFPVQDLEAVLTTTCTRLTFAAPSLGERVTIDLDLVLGDVRCCERFAIVESKSAGPRATADRALVRLGVRPVESCSKVCVGLLAAGAPLAGSGFAPVLRRLADAA